MYLITPIIWDPHNTAYASNEEDMLDWQGNLKDERDRQRILLQDVPEDVNMSVVSYIGHVETQAIKKLLEDNKEDYPKPVYTRVPEKIDQITNVLSSIDPLLDDKTLHDRLNNRCELGKFQMAVESTNASDQQYLFEDASSESDTSSTTISQEEKGEDCCYAR